MNVDPNAVADATGGLPTGETPPQPINVELPEDPAATPPEGEVKPPKRIRAKADERIAALAGDKMTLMQELDRERQRSAELARTLEQRDTQIVDGQARQMELHKARLSSESKQAREELKKAATSGDMDLHADATAKLARCESGLADVEAWEARNKPQEGQPRQQPQQQQEQPRQQPQQPQAQLDPATAGWMTSNPWFQPNSPDFDRTMHLTAVAYASRLEDRLRAEGKVNDIAGETYWNEIDQYMSKEFPDRYEADDQPAQARQPKPPLSPVAPAQRTLPPQQTKVPQGKVLVQLSGAERAMADSLRNSGALVYPKDHPKVQANPALRGQRMSPDDAYFTYAQQIRRDKADQDQRRSNQ